MKRVEFSRITLETKVTFQGQSMLFSELPKYSLFAFWGNEDNKLGNIYVKTTQTCYHVYGDTETVFNCTTKSPVLKLN